MKFNNVGEQKIKIAVQQLTAVTEIHASFANNGITVLAGQRCAFDPEISQLFIAFSHANLRVKVYIQIADAAMQQLDFSTFTEVAGQAAFDFAFHGKALMNAILASYEDAQEKMREEVERIFASQLALVPCDRETTNALHPAVHQYGIFTFYSELLEQLPLGRIIHNLEAKPNEVLRQFSKYSFAMARIKRYKTFAQVALTRLDFETFAFAAFQLVSEVVENLKPLADAIAAALESDQVTEEEARCIQCLNELVVLFTSAAEER